MLKWLKCFVVGHDLTFERELNIYAKPSDSMPCKRYKVYQCTICHATKRKRV